MSRATTSGPVSDSRVFTGCWLRVARMSLIGWVRSIFTTSPASARCCTSMSGMYFTGSVSSCSRNTPSGVILPSAWRSAEQETAIATGHEAPWRGRRTTRTSWQKYFPPNWAPMPKDWVSLKTSSSSSRSRKPWALIEPRSEEHTSELQSQSNLVCRLLLEKKKYNNGDIHVAGHKAASDVRDAFVSVTDKLMDELAQCYNVLPQLDINNTLAHRPEVYDKFF